MMPTEQTRFDHDIIQSCAHFIPLPSTELDGGVNISFARNDLADSGLHPSTLKREKDNKRKTCSRNLVASPDHLMSAARLRDISRFERIKK